ncbi:MAG TPA: glycosyl hydrolase family 28-related protein [Verrucomicrobiales bacterium]|nr:glycosyl hydrolase family 28-related protein [Verrucomicrobiales bacterium]
MTRLASRLLAAPLFLLPLFANAQASPPVFYAADYGALPDDETDDRAAIQAALDAAGEAGGGTVVLGPGVFRLVTVLALGTGGTAGHHGVMVPAHCTLTGAGMNATTFLLVPGEGDNSLVGDGIINKGYQTATEDYGADGDIRVENLRVETTVITTSLTGNLVAFCHADGVVLSSVAVGSSRHHGVEINRSRNVTLEDCVFDGHHPGASSLQLDIGAVGGKSLLPTTTTLENILLRRCVFTGRADEAETSNVKVVELNHTNATCMLHNVAFEECTFEGLAGVTSTCVSVDNPASNRIDGLRFERCHFIGEEKTVCGNGMLNLPLQGERMLRNLVIRDCDFTGAFSLGIVIVHSDPTYNAFHSWRTGIVIEGNRFAPSFDRQVPVQANSLRMICASACSDIIVRRNLFEFPGTGTNLSLYNSIYGIQVANCLDTRIEDNVLTWSHATAAEAPLGWYRMGGIFASVYQLEQSGISARFRMTGNILLYPQNGIGIGVYMGSGVPTTSWAPGGPWVSGLIAGNFASGATSSPGAPSAWYIHHDLSDAGNVGQILADGPSRTRTEGWYPCNGTPLTWLDSGTNRLARTNANKCGYETDLPSEPGNVIRLHGPLTGEGLLASSLQR